MTATRSDARESLQALGRQVRGKAPRGSRDPRRRFHRRQRPPRGSGPGGGGSARIGRSRRRWLIAALIAVAVLVLGWVVAFSPLLAVSRVEVTGVHRLTPQQVVDQARVSHGTPLIRVPRGAIERRVEQLPDVLTASVSISFPSTVVVRVTERTASGVLQLGVDSWALVDDTGHQFTTVATKPDGLPALVPAPAAAADPAVLASMAQVALGVPASVRPLVAQVTATSTEDVTLVLTDHRTVVWGASEQNAQKARVLTALLIRPALFFNVSNPDLPYTR